MTRSSSARPRRVRVRGSLAAVAATALLLTACGNGDAPEDSAGDGEVSAEQTVEVVDNDYSPDDLEVEIGTTVTWENAGDVPHTVTFEDGEDSGGLDAGETSSRTFDEPGEYAYVCEFHPGMDATVTVVE